MTAPASPCVNICQLRPDGICTGCLRSLDEIATWSTLTPAAQRAILADLPRRAAAGHADGISES